MYDRTTEYWNKLHTPSNGLLSSWKKNKKYLSKEQDRILDLFYNKKKTNQQIANAIHRSVALISIQRNNAIKVIKTGVPTMIYRRKDYEAILSPHEIVKRARTNEQLSSLILKKRFQDKLTTVQIARELNLPQMDISILCNLSSHLASRK